MRPDIAQGSVKNEMESNNFQVHLVKKLSHFQLFYGLYHNQIFIYGGYSDRFVTRLDTVEVYRGAQGWQLLNETLFAPDGFFAFVAID